MNGKSNDSIYFYKADRQVIEVHYNGYEDNELYPQYRKFLKKMKFEGLNDIELEYAEPQSQGGEQEDNPDSEGRKYI